MRFGIDLGGTKIEIVALDKGREVLRERIATPQSSYEDTIFAMRDLVRSVGSKAWPPRQRRRRHSRHDQPETGLVKNANSTRLIGHPLDRDLGAALGRPVRVANDANCFALSEASDGAAAGADIVFGVIVGTGCGGGICIGGRVLTGAHAHRRRMGPQSAARAAARRNRPRAEMLLRPRQLHRSLDQRHRPQGRLQAAHRAATSPATRSRRCRSRRRRWRAP